MTELQRGGPSLIGEAMCAVVGVVLILFSGLLAIDAVERNSDGGQGSAAVFEGALVVPIGVLGAVVTAAAIVSAVLRPGRK